MDNSISELWEISVAYLRDGVSLIPVRDKADSKHPAKTAYWGWKRYQDEIISEAELFRQLETFDTKATAIICGKVSGMLELLDVDTKNWEGIDAMLFTQIEAIMPELWSRLRIHKTPSGGFHVPFRISDHEPEGNRKLAWKADQKEAALETRGEGGYFLSNSCANYSIYKENPIPVITWMERCSLFAICESFNQKLKIEAIKPLKTQSEFYDADPFTDYNGRDGGAILSQYGWTVLKQNNKFIWYVRPGKKDGISASFNKEKNIYYIFTSSSEFQPSKGYFPSTVLSKLQFNDDNKECYRWLVDNGFGKVNKIKEMKFAETYAKRKQPIPNNFSEEAKDRYKETTEKINEAYPFGEFIKFDIEEEKTEVSRENFYQVAGLMGFRIQDGNVLKIEEQFVYKCTEREFYDKMKEYIKSEDPEEHIKLLNIYEKFIQKNGSFSISRLPEFDEDLLLKDDKQNAYLFFQNGWIHITSSEIKIKDYSELDQLVYYNKVKERDYIDVSNEGSETIDEEGVVTVTGGGGVYLDFLSKAIGYNDYSASIIGFLCHDFKDETTGYIPVFTEKCENPEDGGGAGKNVLCNSFSWTTTYINKNCSGAKFDEKFFQMWNGQKILGLSDLPEHFNFLDLKEAVTGSLLHKRLFHDEVEVPVSKTPKMVCQTNYSVELKDGGVARRVCLLEFTDYFTKVGGIDVHYGKHFPNDFTKEDWLGYDNVIAMAIQIWIRNGCKIKKPDMSATGWTKQFKQTYGITIYDIIITHIDKWKKEGRVLKEDFNKDINQYYSENNIQKKYEPSMIKLNKAIIEYCSHYDLAFDKDYQWSEMNVKYKGKYFGIVGENENE